VILRYELTRWDVFVTGLRALLFQRTIMCMVFLSLCGIWWITFSNTQKVEEPDSIASAVIATGGVLTFLVCGTLGAIIVTAMHACMRNGKGILGEHTLEITDEGLVESTEVNTTLHSWNSAFRIRRTGSYIFIFVATGVGHIVPLKRLPIDGSVDEFIEELGLQIRKSRQSCQPG
jgi:YcxB-like protein